MKCGKMNRPKSSNLKSIEEFNEYYWYKDELIKICRKLSLDPLGIKAELEERLRNYLQGIPTENKRKISNSIR
ncbi:MAG TPA: SAP domain-containing protein [Tissierellales bacterium]|nr:SAP domain-containing protein [Tissierellales bacterium]